MRKIIPAFLIIALTFLTGFVPLPDKVLDRCARKTVSGPASFRAALNGRPGILEVLWPGAHRFIPDYGEVMVDPGPGLAATTPGGDQALWRLLDFYSGLTGDDLADILRLSGVDMNRRGWVRLDEGGDRLGVTIGALGETEPAMPQAIIDNVSFRLVSVRMPDGSQADAGPTTESGWPGWISLGGSDLLQLISGPRQPTLPDSASDPTAVGPDWWRSLMVEPEEEGEGEELNKEGQGLAQ